MPKRPLRPEPAPSKTEDVPKTPPMRAHSGPRRGRAERQPPRPLLLFFKQKTAYEIGLGIPAEPLFRSNVITSCSVTMMLFLHLEVKPLMTLTTVLYLSCALISGHLAMMLMELTKR